MARFGSTLCMDSTYSAAAEISLERTIRGCVCVFGMGLDGVGPQWKADAQGKLGFVNIKSKKPQLLFVECDVLPGIFVKQCRKGNTSSFPYFFHGTITTRVCSHVHVYELC